MVGTEHTALIIDAGIAYRNIQQSLERLGISPEEISGILITHEHSDHIKSLRTLSKRTGDTPIYGSKGTLDAIIERYLPSLGRDVLFYIAPEEGAFTIGDIEITPFRLSHDAAEPLGYVFRSGDRRIAILTDTGVVTGSAMEAIREADILVMEANHEENVLLMGPYPWPLKRRILGEQGHLSNETAANSLAEILRDRINPNPPTIALAHLSKENNTPDLAFLTVKQCLIEHDFTEGIHYRMCVLARDAESGIFRA